MNASIEPDLNHRVVVIGAGHGGGNLVALLRQSGFSGRITLVGDEATPPYQRPPLSKAWLTGELATDKLLLRPLAFYQDQHVELRLGQRTESIDRASRHITLGSGEQLPYDDLVLATGARPRALPLDGARLANVLTLRNLADAEALRAALGPGKRLVIIGGGYIGLECAATARGLGAEVVMLERLPRLLERVASAPIAEFLHRHHAERGVDILTAVEVTAIEGEQRATAVHLADGRRLACDAILVGIGAIPATELAVAAGLACDNGVSVDADCRSSDPHIFAIGDVANRPHPLYGRALRLESVPSAIEQAKRVAAALTSREPASAEVPWFWSDQYGLKLQIAGLPFDADEIVVRGDPESAKFAVFHLRQGRVVTVESVSDAQAFMVGKKLVGSGRVVDAARLTDQSVALGSLLA
jgi:3-phenylpropionate/trans-cinnamate dioxygenase ferredoxin reductase component